MDQVIYKTGAPKLQTVVKNGLCTFSGCHRDNGQDFTVPEYLEFLGPGFVCISFDTALEQIRVAEESKYIGPWESITIDKWDYCLEVLPPEKWKTVNGVNFFRMTEYMTGDITLHCARVDDRCFQAYRRTSSKYKDLSNEIKAIL